MAGPNPESLVIAWAKESGLLAHPFYADVPAERPDKFFTVERTGGGSSFYQDRPMLAVQAWAGSRLSASDMIYRFREAAWSSLRYHPNVAHLTVNTITHFPSADNRPRYQALIELVTA